MAQPLRSSVREQPSRPVPRIQFVDEQLNGAYDELARGNVAGFVERHRAAGVTVPRDLVISWGRKALWRGDFQKGCAALQLVNAKPSREDLLACAEAAAQAGDARSAEAAAVLAADGPPKSRRR